MFKRRFQRGFLVVAMLITAVSLGACGADEFSSGISAQQRTAVRTTDAAIDATGLLQSANATELAPHAIVERRHFDVYKRYRILADASDGGGPPLMQDGKDGLRPAVVTFSEATATEFPACSLRVLQHFD